MDSFAPVIADADGDLTNVREAFLRPLVKAEPLVDRWYAWPQLLAPAPQAMHLAFRYLPLMRSFITSPSVHSKAADDPKMFSGPFAALPKNAVDDARLYIHTLEERRADALAFARTYREFDVRLHDSANGHSLDEFKENLPEILRGLVELVYDVHNHPKVRVLEEMLVENDFGFSSAQEVVLHTQADVDRPFFLSTPRLSLDGGLFIRKPFGSEGVKSLSRARCHPVDLTTVSDELGVDIAQLRPFFTDQPTGWGAPRFAGQGVRVRYFGHASLLIETDAVSILVDPTAAQDPPEAQAHFWTADFPEVIDYLVLSHGHQDHFCAEFLMQLRDRVGVVVIPSSNRGELSDPSMKLMLKSLGYERIMVVDPLERIPIPGGQLTSLPFSGEHSDLDVHGKQCLLVEIKSRKICLFVDTDAIDLDTYRRLEQLIAEPDAMFVGMECFGAPLSWYYGPLLSVVTSRKSDGSRRLSGANCDRAWRLAQLVRPKRAYVYAMGQEPWMKYLMGLNYTPDSIQMTESEKFVEMCRSDNLESERLYKRLELVI